jgi:hypothetical protein
MNVCVYTVILNHWDYLQPPEVVGPDCRYICFSDTPQREASPWEVVPLDPMPLAEAKRNARLPKILPHLFLPDDTDISIYHDGSFRMKVLPEQAIERWLGGAHVALFDHPARTCVFDEAAICLREGIGDAEAIRRQVTRYEALDWPKGAGLWCGGIIMRHHEPQVARFNETWWREFLNYSDRDQLALPYALRTTKLVSSRIPGHVYTSDGWGFVWHAAWKDKGANPSFLPWHEAENQRCDRVRELCQLSTASCE